MAGLASPDTLAAQLLGGVALLLWGVRMVRTGITRAHGAALRRVLSRWAGRRVAAAAAGTLVTLLLQSGTATSLIVASFTARGMLATADGLAVLLGADLGSALVARVLAGGISALWPWPLVAGVAIFLASEEGRVRHQARVLVGLGMVMLALAIIGQVSAPLRESALLRDVLAALAGAPLLAFSLAAVLTWVVHSSLAVVLLVASLAAGGVVGGEVGLALLLGANLGATFAPLASTSDQPPPARRAPLGNLVLRGAAAFAVLPFAPAILPWLEAVPGGAGMAVLHGHVAFNAVVLLVGLPLTGPLAALLGRVFPDPAPGNGDVAAPRHLDDEALAVPALALANATREALRAAEIVERMLEGTIEVYLKDDARKAAEIERMDDGVDRIHAALVRYLVRLTHQNLEPAEAARHLEILTFSTNLEHAGDIIDKNLMELARKKIDRKLHFSDEGMAELVAFHGKVLANLRLGIHVFTTGDAGLARELSARKAALRDAERLAVEHHLARVAAGVVESIETSALHVDVLRDLRRVNSHVTSVAYPVLEANPPAARTKVRKGR